MMHLIVVLSFCHILYLALSSSVASSLIESRLGVSKIKKIFSCIRIIRKFFIQSTKFGPINLLLSRMIHNESEEVIMKLST